MYEVLKKEVSSIIADIKDEKLKVMFEKCFYNTLDTTIHYVSAEDIYVITGDIEAMWLRDSSAQVIQYLGFVNKDPDVLRLFKGLLKRQYFYISVDPYSNSFNKEPNGAGHTIDEGLRTPYTWERKFEIDSLCYPIWLTYKLYKATGDKSVLSKDFVNASKIILKVFKDETDHENLSTYYHYRPGELEEFCIPNHGKGGPVKNCGLIWSGYRPSDDACKYGFFIPGNMFASVILGQMAELFEVIGDDTFAKEVLDFKKDLDFAIENYGVINHPKFGKMYVYETDNLGNYLLMDDANVPSLLSIPYFGYKDIEDEVYQNTRKFCLSFENPFYVEGEILSGIGSPHTPKDYVWHIGIVLQGLTTNNKEEILKMINMVKNSDNGTYLTHEGIHKNDQSIYTREWFAWSNSLFSYLLLSNLDLLK